MKSKAKPCPICSKPIRFPSMGWAKHLAWHEAEEKLASKYGWSDRNPFKANRPNRDTFTASSTSEAELK